MFEAKQKCAEIYHLNQEQKLFILCLSCQFSTHNYDEFLLHFMQQHLWQTAAANSTTSADPLDLNIKAEAADENSADHDLQADAAAEPKQLVRVKSKRKAIEKSENAKQSRIRNNGKPSKACSYCGRTFRRRYQLQTHLNIHTGLKPHQCEICGRQFRAVTTLQRHLNTHEQRATMQCKYCSKCFKHKAALMSHELRHTQARSQQCDECQKYFYTANQLDTHKRKVHHKTTDEALLLSFVCALCQKRYRSASMLSTHKLKKHYRTAKFSCEKCDKKCVSEQELQQHQLIHVPSKQTEAVAL